VSAPLQIGRYVLHGQIAAGGMAAVHYGRLLVDLGPGGPGGFARIVAIKRLHTQLTALEAFRTTLLEEARLAARIRHPNVVAPLDVIAETGELLLVMEYVHGQSLSRLMRASREAKEVVSLGVGATILSHVLHGLHAAHEAKDEGGAPLSLVHRDISPENVLVGVDGVARVIDFGIAKAASSVRDTAVGKIKGKLPYLAPEQIEGMPASRRTDLFAAAIVCWEVLAGERLFSGREEEIVEKILSMQIPPPSSKNPMVPPALDDVIMKGLARAPVDRFPSAREMALELEAAVHLATTTQVGAWVERLAAEALAERSACVREVEQAAVPEGGTPAGAAGMPAGAGTPAPEAAVAPALPLPPPPPPRRESATPPPPPPRRESAAPPPVVVEVAADETPALPPPPPRRESRKAPPVSGEKKAAVHAIPRSSAPAVIEQRTIIYEPPSLPAPEFVAGVRAVSAEPPPRPPPGPGHSAPPLPPPGALAPVHPGPSGNPPPYHPHVPPAAPSSAPAANRTAPRPALRFVPRPTLGSSVRRFFLYLALFLLVGFAMLWMLSGTLVRSWVVSSAAERGLRLTVERVEVSRRAVHLVGLHAESAELPGLTLKIGSADLALRWLAPERVVLDDVQIGLQGSYVEVGDVLARWRLAHAVSNAEAISGIQSLEITSGTVEWPGVIGLGTRALAENIVVDARRAGGRPLGEDYHFSTPLLRVSLGELTVGPWQIDVDRQGILTRSALHFDPTGTYPSMITRLSSEDGSSRTTFAVPPVALGDLRVPAALFHGLATARSRIEARGEIEIGSTPPSPRADLDTSLQRKVTGKVALALGALGAFAKVGEMPPAPLVDLSFELPFTGEIARPMPITASLAIAPADPSGGVLPPLTHAPLIGVVDLSGRAPRVELGGRSGVLACRAPKDRSGTGLQVAAALAFDQVTAGKLTAEPTGACLPRLAEPPPSPPPRGGR